MVKQRKKVLFTSHVANFQKFNRPFMRMLSEQGYEVHYASMGEEEIFDCDKSFIVPFTRSPFGLSNIAAYRQLKEIIEREHYDIIHTHTPMGSVVTRLAARAARKKGTRVIYTAHGFHFFKGAPLLNWLIYYPVERYMARHTDTLITINKEDYERAKAQFKTNVQYVPGVGIDPKKFDFKMTKLEKSELRKSLGLKDNDFVMLYPAELNKNKNQKMLVDVMEKLVQKYPNIHLLLPGKDSSNGFHKRYIEQKGLTKNVHLLGYRNDIPKLLKITDLSVSTSRREGLPVNIMEAMYTGLPVVATDCRGNSDLVENGKSGFVVPQGDSRKFLDSILCLYKDKSLGTTISKITKKVCEKYLLNGVMDSMGLLYKKESKIILHLLASNQYSGAENVASEIIRNTDPSHFNSFYVSPSGPINEILDQKNVRHISIKKMSYGELRRIVRSYNPDIIHAHDFRASILASYFSMGIRIISHIHQNPEWLNRINHKSLLYRLRMSRFHRIIVVTDAMRGNYVFKTNSGNRVVTIRNSIDIERIRELGDEPHDKKYDLIFCGRLEDVKQPLDFLSIVQEIKKNKPDIKAVMVGEGGLRGDCEQYIEVNNLSDNVELVGFQTNPYKFMKNSKFLVLTSKNEGFGLVVIESIALGIIPLAYDLPSTKEILKRIPCVLSVRDELPGVYWSIVNGSTVITKDDLDGVLTTYVNIDYRTGLYYN